MAMVAAAMIDDDDKRLETISSGCMRVKQSRSAHHNGHRPHSPTGDSIPERTSADWVSHAFCLNKVPNNLPHFPPSRLSFSPAIFPFFSPSPSFPPFGQHTLFLFLS
jgi:hypothetical protein